MRQNSWSGNGLAHRLSQAVRLQSGNLTARITLPGSVLNCDLNSRVCPLSYTKMRPGVLTVVSKIVVLPYRMTPQCVTILDRDPLNFSNKSLCFEEMDSVKLSALDGSQVASKRIASSNTIQHKGEKIMTKTKA